MIGDVSAKAKRDTQLQESHVKIGLRHHWWEWSETGGTLNNLRPHHWSDTLHIYPQVIWYSRQKRWKPDTPLRDRWYLAVVTHGRQNIKGSWREQFHRMVVATSRVKLRKTGGKRPRRQWFDVKKLQNLKVSSTFVLHLKKNFQALADLEDYLQSDKEDTNVKKKQRKTAYFQASKTCLASRQRKKKE